ncbi:MAG TPA: DUF4157 domain-containing protein [Methanosarcina sp.]|nr:DUF4157 domain-containing protein [Methanosarcina sp.]
MPEHQQIQQSKKPDTSFQKQATPAIQTPLSNPYSIIQRAKINPKSLTHADIMQLQRTIGNRAVAQLLSGIVNSSAAQQAIVQRQEISEEEESLQGKMIGTIQRQEIPEEEEPLEGKFESKPEKVTCPSCFAAPIVQKQEIPEEEEKPLQGKMIGTTQRQEIPEEEEPLQTKRENNTGMPDNLKAGVESLSGIDMSDVRVHFNSSKPAEVGALAYTQGTDIHVASGQEQYLPHEAWHVVQQKQGRVQPTMQMKEGVPVNDDVRLEHEADVMGNHASKLRNIISPNNTIQSINLENHSTQGETVQAKPYEIVENNPNRGKVEVTTSADKITVEGQITNKNTNISTPVEGDVMLHEYKTSLNRSVPPKPNDQGVPDALRVHNINAHPRKMNLGQLLTYHHGLVAISRNIPYVIAMDVTAAREPFYEPLGFIDYDSSQPYKTLKQQVEAIKEFLIKDGPFESDEQRQYLIEEKVRLTMLMANSSMIILSSDLVENSKKKWENVWTVDIVKEDSGKPRGMEYAYEY